jgi:hypothetical protein
MQPPRLTKSVDISLGELPHGSYTIQVLWDQDREESRINAPGNLYSESVRIDFMRGTTVGAAA